jgi:hypothetical protein
MARLEQGDLAERSNVSVDTIKRLERTVGPISANVTTMAAVVGALESSGIEFTNGAQPGVRMMQMRTDDELLRDFINVGPCQVSVGGHLVPGLAPPSLREALFWAGRSGKSVSSILIPNKAHIGADQIRRLLDQQQKPPA